MFRTLGRPLDFQESRQITSEYYYSGGGELFPVTDLKSALEAIELIMEQGEGDGGGIYDDDEHE
ncbi:ferritin-like domain-containing protein, partial [Rhizobium ruizarguesonis]